MKNKIINIFKRICFPFIENTGGPKVKAILSEIETTPYTKEYIRGVGLIVNKQDFPRVIITSHMDLIPLFNKGFKECKTFFEENEILYGALDNTLTNAFLIQLIKETSYSDIEFVFSEGEETGMTGIRNYMLMFPEKKISSFFINLDVTNDGSYSYCSVEYDRPDINGILDAAEALNNISDIIPHFQFYRFCDDMDAILSGGGHGFSYCIPTNNVIHSYKSNTDIKNIEPFYFGLKALSEKMDLSRIGQDNVNKKVLIEKYPYLAKINNSL